MCSVMTDQLVVNLLLDCQVTEIVVSVDSSLHMCVCVCVREREKERERWVVKRLSYFCYNCAVCK